MGFTGSREGGLAIAAMAADRPVPIPVYAEMSSINPVLLLPAALESRGAELGAAFAGSLSLGAGQFCTNPGLVLAVEGPGLEAFTKAAADAVAADAGATMLTTGIADHYAAAGDALAARGRRRSVRTWQPTRQRGVWPCPAADRRRCSVRRRSGATGRGLRRDIAARPLRGHRRADRGGGDVGRSAHRDRARR
ncbi:hypothetical protein SANTM175S_00200 [Streptomyces antimycoticus]